MKKRAIIIGAGPAGLTAAYELLEKTDIVPIVFESSKYIGGISKTINYNGNRMDVGPHRFFSKSDKVMQWWQSILPLQGKPAKDDIDLNRKVNLSKIENAPDPEKEDKVMLIRDRLSRILYSSNLIDYPLSFKISTFYNLGLFRVVKIGLSYLRFKIFPVKEEKNLEDYLINLFGKELYLIFFKDYTEKVWGVSCKKISAEWGAQRIKGLNISKILFHSLKRLVSKNSSISQKNIETSLINSFMYPKYGAGQLWEEVAQKIRNKGGEVYLEHHVQGISINNNNIVSIAVKDKKNQNIKEINGDYFFSSMPVKELVNSLVNQTVPENVHEISNNLLYRDFITIGVLLNKLKICNKSKIKTLNNMIPDNWIYVQEPEVKIGRFQVVNNWSPYLLKDNDKVLIGAEYFCNEGDEIWSLSDDNLSDLVLNELKKINIIEKEDVIDSFVIRMPKAYPAYFGSYDRFDEVRDYLNQFYNLFLIGRNGMHRYNNMDHSMLSAMAAVDNIIKGITTKDNIWAVNEEREYHERK